MEVNLIINKKPRTVHIRPDETLIETLRGLGLNGVKQGCDTGSCGVCTVHMDGKAILSCTQLTAMAEGRGITTIEGVQQQAEQIGQYLVAEGVEQCGYCSPGTVMSILYLESCIADPSDDDILHYLNGNLCRCSGYEGQLRAIRTYLEAKRNESDR